MKYILIFIIIIFSGRTIAQKTKLDQYANSFERELKGWMASFKNFKLSEFKKTDSLKFDNIEGNDIKTVKSFLSVYKPILTFTKDGTQFIDIYSYQLNLEKKGNHYLASPDIDQAVYLCNMKSKYWKRIFFGSMSSYIDDAIWLSGTKFILAGTSLNDKDKRVPRILLGDESTGKIDEYLSSNQACVEKSGYTSPKLKRIRIEGL